MNVGIIFLDYQRHEHTPRALMNLANAGYPFDLVTVQTKGVAKALNEGICGLSYWDDYHGFIFEYDAVVTMANDITMPQDWLKKMVIAAKTIAKTGIVGIHTVESLPDKDNNNVHPTFMPFGNVLIMKEVIEKIGYFNTDHDPYGMQDSDYGYRATKAGFYNYYLPDMKAEHIGHDVGNIDEYRKMKDEGLSFAGEKHLKWVAHYETTGNYYLPLNQHSIEKTST
jgi:GT2 family glycosyltransferase